MFCPLCVIQKRMAQPKHWLMRVAMAAPVMPSSKYRMSNGARIRFSNTPDMMPFIAYIVLPWKRIMLLRVSEVVMKGAPNRIMPR